MSVKFQELWFLLLLWNGISGYFLQLQVKEEHRTACLDLCIKISLRLYSSELNQLLIAFHYHGSPSEPRYTQICVYKLIDIIFPSGPT